MGDQEDYINARELFDYNKNTGVFLWRVDKKPAKKGAVAGCCSGGYRLLRFCGKMVRAHRVAWLYENGAWPIGDLDHINGKKDDNRIANLRIATKSLNSLNVHAPRLGNTSGFRGVSFNKRFKKFYARIFVNGSYKWLGYHDSPDAAHRAYITAKQNIEHKPE